jgi:hypothetical protein
MNPSTKEILMHAHRAFILKFGVIVATTLFVVASVAFATIPWNLGQHPGEAHRTLQNEPQHLT